MATVAKEDTGELITRITDSYCELRDAARRVKRADRELRRATNSGDPERLNKAGTSYAIAKINLFKLVK